MTQADSRTLVIQRTIHAPRSVVWGAWFNAEALPQWWGPDGYTCKTERIDLREGGEWVFDMIGPDGTVFPNHHKYVRVQPQSRIDYVLHWGFGGPKHADAWVSFEDSGDNTVVTLRMTLVTQKEYDAAVAYHAVELGQQTLGKLARFIGAA